MTESQARLVKGPVGSHLKSLTIPMIWGIAAIMSLNIVDTWFVAQLSERHLAAISFTFPLSVRRISSILPGTHSGYSQSRCVTQ